MVTADDIERAERMAISDGVREDICKAVERGNSSFTKDHPEAASMLYLADAIVRAAEIIADAIDRRDDGSMLGESIKQAMGKGSY